MPHRMKNLHQLENRLEDLEYQLEEAKHASASALEIEELEDEIDAIEWEIEDINHAYNKPCFVQ